MKLEALNTPFNIFVQSEVVISEVDLKITLKNLSRLMIPRRGDQFVMTIALEWNAVSDEIGFDGEFCFDNRVIGKKWQNFWIQIHDISMAADFAKISVKKT
jgi:NADH/NAD ratio-sensing transcriptional regulator Rex